MAKSDHGTTFSVAKCGVVQCSQIIKGYLQGHCAMRLANSSITTYRQHYQAPDFAIQQITLEIDLDYQRTVVTSTLTIHQRVQNAPLVLQGQDLKLIRLAVDGVDKNDFALKGDSLIIENVPANFELTVVTECQPEQNTSLMGLYVSRGNFFTQCEAEGFRKITYFLDRPDVMSCYTVTLRANKKDCPILLSNGNLIASGPLDNDRHYATWQDPFPKPSYLFALVAGKLACIEETIKTASGQPKLLQVWVEPSNLDKTRYAMDSLIAAIRWDEQRFGLELDLERFMIVAVSDFNMGAMENKGLNIFNAQYVLADPEHATDTDYAGIEGVVAHEYFHNWTGNRVTCRDWFQLSLKEGLTVFRDQEFSADMMGSESGRAVKRIEDVYALRQTQFPEDAGPMAHPVRPDSYQEINNFYTATVYEKGAEVIRMYQTILSETGFRLGMDLYFQRHDGQAVTCDDFLAAMADANQTDLTQFALWYSQAGTPQVEATGHWHANTKTYQLHLRQTCPATPGQSSKQPFYIPIKTALIDSSGQAMPLRLSNSSVKTNSSTEATLILNDIEQTFVFDNIQEQPTPSLLRNFSAPIILTYPYTDNELLQLLRYDDDAFNRWEAGQRLALTRILDIAKLKTQQPSHESSDLKLDQAFIAAIANLIQDTSLSPAFRAQLATLPSEAYIAQHLLPIDPQAIHFAREFVRTALAKSLEKIWANLYESNQTTGTYRPDADSMGKRALKNLALAMLAETHNEQWHHLAFEQFTQANNMTDRFSALSTLVYSQAPQAQQALDHFYDRYQHHALAIDKWFRLQALCKPQTESRSIVERVSNLTTHPDFTLHNPNRARSVIHSFCLANQAGFHLADGRGYQFWKTNVIALDTINPQIAATLARALDRWKAFAQPWQGAMQEALHQVASEQLSKNTREVIDKALAEAI